MRINIETPVVLIIYNRPDLVKRQIEVLSQVNLKYLFIVADGPKAGGDDEGRCAAVRELIDGVSWKCILYRDYAKENLGCARRIVSGIDWVFRNVDRAIILEDDCIPHPSFFEYCDSLLELYKDEEDVMHICGMRPFEIRGNESDYWFSHHVSCWGWATWRRAWVHNDLAMKMTDSEERELLARYLFGNAAAIAYWKNAIAKTRNKQLDAWDYPWQLSIWRNGGLSIFPCRNLVTNAGFRSDATHTKSEESKWANIPKEQMDFPIKHPSEIKVNTQFDIRFVDEVFNIQETKEAPGWMGFRFLQKAIMRLAKKG